jgi:hypothetical protein
MKAEVIKLMSVGGRKVRVLDLIDAADMIGCSLESLVHWLDCDWINVAECPCCQAIYATYDDVLDIVHLATLDQQSSFESIVAHRFEDLHTIVEERMSPTTQCLPTPPSRSRQRYARIERQQTRRLAQEMEQEQVYVSKQETQRLKLRVEYDSRGRELVRHGCEMTEYLPDPEEIQEPRRRSWWPLRRRSG